MATIRRAELTDTSQIEYICRMTAGPGCRREPVIGKRVANMYSTYYIRECPDTCFVLADDNNRAVGYILCEANYKRFKKIYRKKDVPHIFSLNKKDGIKAFFLPVPYQLFGKDYPAHLHIDILPEYQGKGYGTKLINTLFSTLKERGIKGIMLTADLENAGARRFYERLGFEILAALKQADGIIMGKRL